MRRRLVLGMKGTQNQVAQRPREKGLLTWGREYANPSRSRRSLPPVSGPPPLWVVFVVIYSSLPFIFLLHLSVIHAYPQVHVPSAILSGALWVAVAPIALSRGHIHIKGGQGVNCVYLIRRWQLFWGCLPTYSLMASPYGLEYLLWSSSGCPWAMWRFFLPWFWPAKDRVVLGSTFWQFGFPSFVPGHFFLLGVGLGLRMEWDEASRTFWPHNSPSKSCCPAPRAGRRILMSSGLNHGPCARTITVLRTPENSGREASENWEEEEFILELSPRIDFCPPSTPLMISLLNNLARPLTESSLRPSSWTHFFTKFIVLGLLGLSLLTSTVKDPSN